MKNGEILLFQRNVDQWPPARLNLLLFQKMAKHTGKGVKSDVNEDEEEKRASEAALLDTVARILKGERSQLENGGPVNEGDIERFLQSAKARHCF